MTNSQKLSTCDEILKPCPFCGSNDLHVLAGVTHVVKCHGCWAKVQCHDSREDAIAAWNKRPAEEKLRVVLVNIAAYPLWGESIEDSDTRKEYIESGQYDWEGEEFNPSSDTECTMLRDAVEAARAAIAKAKAAA